MATVQRPTRQHLGRFCSLASLPVEEDRERFETAFRILTIEMTTAKDHGPFQYTATGVLGEQRGTMLANELHLRDELGKSRKHGYVQFPGQTFCYGRPNPPRAVGVAETLRWTNAPITGSKQLSFRDAGKNELTNYPRDFVRLNRAAVDRGLFTSRQQSDFRANNDLRVIPKPRSRRNTESAPPSDMVFGYPARPSTPIHFLIEHKYQDEWLDQQRRIQLARAKKAQVQKLPAGAYHENHTSQLRNYINSQPSEQRPLWKMSRFSKSTRGNLDTFRSPDEKHRAYKQHINAQSKTLARPVYY